MGKDLLAFGRSSNEVKTSFIGLRGQWLHRGVAFIAGMGFLLFGYDQGVMGSLLTLDTFVKQFPDMDSSSSWLSEETKRHNTTIQGTAVGIYEIGCMMGALFTMWAGDKFGRRRIIFFGSFIMIVGTVIMTSSYTLGQFIVGRIVTGLGNGFITATVPMWQSECAKPERRGALVMMEGALITGGICLSYWIDFGFYFVDSDADWRFPIAFQIVFALFLFFTVMSLPESPRWLIKKGRIEEASGVFAALEDVELDDPYVVNQVTEVKESIMMEQLATLGIEGDQAKRAIRNGEHDISEELPFRQQLSKLFTFGKKKNFHRTMLAYWNQVMQQITGINLITYYAAFIYEESLKMSALNSRILAACNGTEYFLASWLPFYTIERFGRRKLMLFGAIGQAATMAILTGTVYAATPKDAKPYPGLDNSDAGIAAAVFLFVFNTFFAIGWLGMTWLYPAEITSLEIRAPANGLSTSGNWVFNFMVVMITPVAFNNIGYYTYTIFACINALMVPVVYFFYPETAGRTLEEIDKIFAQSNPKTPWDVVGIARRFPKTTAQDNEKQAAYHDSETQDSELSSNHS
uniref:Putative sugar porter n=1 Tax=[Candida] hispaniensis TaxID=312227 RepID=A0A1N6MC79_9ASCO|nr:putative sugar porter [[Candida] hispaniensis]